MKKGEDTEVLKGQQFDVIFAFIENICHIVQRVNKNSAKFMESTLRQAREEMAFGMVAAAVVAPTDGDQSSRWELKKRKKQKLNDASEKVPRHAPSQLQANSSVIAEFSGE